MNETVTITPSGGRDDDGNPVTGGDPVVVAPIAIAPGNTTVQFTDSGNVDSADFTVYFRLGVEISDGDVITVRGRDCLARVQEWINPYANHGGVVVLCTSDTGAS